MSRDTSPNNQTEPGERPRQDESVTVLNPRMRVPVSLIIDDSTCLVNLNHFAIPQFTTARGETQEFSQRWREMPREIPDDFVRKFGNWCGENGVKGKYSIVPFPACVGRLDRLLPGWTQEQLDASIELVQTLMTPNWDIHPEMVTHTCVIDTKTGHPYPERGIHFQENWRWTDGKSIDELSDYMRYALNILKNIGFSCKGITTPGGFGIRVLPALAQATLESCRDVFQAEIPHYFRHIWVDERSVAPQVEYASGLDGDDPKCVVSIIGCTGDWTGGWDCSDRGDADRFITPDLESGRMIDVIERGEPAAMVCHWQGIHFNGEEVGFEVFKEVVRRLHARYDHLIWMKLSEVARYWAAKELTRIEMDKDIVTFNAPLDCPGFTVRIEGVTGTPSKLEANIKPVALREVSKGDDLETESWMPDGKGAVVCFDLPKGESSLISVSNEDS